MQITANGRRVMGYKNAQFRMRGWVHRSALASMDCAWPARRTLAMFLEKCHSMPFWLLQNVCAKFAPTWSNLKLMRYPLQPHYLCPPCMTRRKIGLLHDGFFPPAQLLLVSSLKYLIKYPRCRLESRQFRFARCTILSLQPCNQLECGFQLAIKLTYRNFMLGRALLFRDRPFVCHVLQSRYEITATAALL